MTELPMLHHVSSVDPDCRAYEGVVHRGGTIAPPSPGDVTIMLVDDEPDLRRLISRALRREGYQIVDAGDGIEALALLEAHSSSPVHLLITDLDMPRLGGVDLARHLRDSNQIQRVIFMTGNSPDGPLIEGGYNTLIQKPFNLKALSLAIQALLADQVS